MSYEKLLSGYQGQDYGKLLERVYGKEKVKPVEEAPVIPAPAPVPAARAGREVSSILGSDPFGNNIILDEHQRKRLLYFLGVTGAGKSTMLLNLILQNIEQGYGVAILDPHGSLVEDVILCMPASRRKDVIFLDIADAKEYVFGINLYQCDDITDISKVQRTMERIMHVWERLFHVNRDTPQMVQYMRKCAQTIIPNPGYTMAEIPYLFTDIPFRNRMLLNVTNKKVHDFWEDYDKDTKTDQMHNKGSILRKLDEFLVPIVEGIVGQSRSTIDMQDIINADPGKILLVKLDNDLEGITSLIGSIIVAAIRSAAFFRKFMDEKDRKPFFLYADEFDGFATKDFQDIIKQTRKYYVFPICAQQSRDVLHLEVPKLVAATLQGNKVVFPGINDVDAREMAGSFDTTPPEPDMEEWGKEEITTPVTDVLGALLSKGSQENPIINEFVFTYLSRMDQFVKGSEDRRVVICKNLLVELNECMYQAMVHKNVSTSIQGDFLARLIFGFRPILACEYGLGWVDTNSPSNYDKRLDWEMDYDVLYQLFNTLWLSTGTDFDTVAENFREKVLYIIQANWEAGFLRDRAYFPNVVVDSNFAEKGYSLAENERVITFIKVLRGTMQALADNEPISQGNGQYRPIFRPGQQLTSVEMAGRIANKLSGNPDYTAYVRIGGNIQYCWNCGKKPDLSDKKCQAPDCQKDLKHEYTVSVTPVQKDESVSVDVLIADIVKRNVEEGYLRLRSQVESEIEARQNPPTEQKTAAPATPTGENKPAPALGAGALVPGASRRRGKKGV